MTSRKKIALFPGSFDPVTNGHIDILQRAAPLFDEIILAIGKNTSKNSMFSTEQRVKICSEAVSHLKNVQVKTFTGLTVDFCKELNAGFILRGLRNSKDYEYEASIYAMNQKLNPEVETVFLVSSPEVAFISSTIVREIILNKGDISAFVPKEVLNFL